MFGQPVYFPCSAPRRTPSSHPRRQNSNDFTISVAAMISPRVVPSVFPSCLVLYLCLCRAMPCGRRWGRTLGRAVGHSAADPPEPALWPGPNRRLAPPRERARALLLLRAMVGPEYIHSETALSPGNRQTRARFAPIRAGSALDITQRLPRNLPDFDQLWPTSPSKVDRNRPKPASYIWSRLQRLLFHVDALWRVSVS